MTAKQEISSFEKINYMLRPMKQIERKITIEILQELQEIIPNFDNYRYIGMGSIYYYDYILFHKYLKINKYTSIDNKPIPYRFRFNKPYDFIDFINVPSTEFLDNFEFNTNIIIWLDYDSFLNEDIFNDFALLSRRCNENDIVIFTLNVTCPRMIKKRESVMKPFVKYLSQKYQPFNNFLNNIKFPYLYQDICVNYFSEQCASRDIKFNKIFAIEYADNATMLTFAGIMGKTDNLAKNLSHICITLNEKILKIKVPYLTYKEKIYLDSKIDYIIKNIERVEHLIELENISKEEQIGFIKSQLGNEFELSLEDLKQYAKYYKYYPQYYEGLI